MTLSHFSCFFKQLFCKWTRKEGKKKKKEKEKGGNPRHYEVFSDFQENFQMPYSIKSYEKVTNQGH